MRENGELLVGIVTLVVVWIWWLVMTRVLGFTFDYFNLPYFTDNCW